MLIILGHGAYSGTNACRWCFSKAQAVRVLRNRGMTRDEARRALNKVIEQMVRDDTHQTLEIEHQLCEMRVFRNGARPQGVSENDMARIRNELRNCSEL